MVKKRSAGTGRGTEKSEPELLAGGGLWGGNLRVFQSLPSTNRWVLENQDVCRHGDVVWALSQTSGRGRRDRSWISRPGKGLCLSLVLRELPERDILPLVGQATALAVAGLLEEVGLAPRIKWPNDIQVNGKKAAGILTESVHGRLVVIGTGLNVNQDAQDLEEDGLGEAATSLRIELGRKLDLEKTRITLLAFWKRELEGLAGQETALLLKRWRSRDALAGQYVTVREGNRLFPGAYQGIDSRGRLRLLLEDGGTMAFWTGDVIQVRAGAPDGPDKKS
jgi:BirA family biotin operon repressor/biotin-[acetyl-CoA-carboxylase] ligase